MPLLVPEEDFENAVKWLRLRNNRDCPAIGGIIIAFNIQAYYVLSVLSSLLFAIFMLFMLFLMHLQRMEMLEQMAEGIRFVGEKFYGATSLDLFAVLLGGAVYLLPFLLGILFTHLNSA